MQPEYENRNQSQSADIMLKWVVFLFMANGLMAAKRSKEEIEAFKAYVYESQLPSNKTMEERMAENPKAEPWENSGRYQGDIVLLERDIEQLIEEFSADDNDDLNKRNGVIDRNRLWPGAVVPYEIDARFTQSERNEIIRVANIYHQRTCVRWVNRRNNERDFVFISAHPDGGCTAQVAFARNHGRHWLNLARPGCLRWTTIFHEMGHSIGFYHMHQTNTRYNYIWINWNNIHRGMWCPSINRYVNMLRLPYEYNSNQHYHGYAFSMNGQRTIGARFPTNEMGQRYFVTGVDIWRIARLYNCPGAWSVEVKPEDVNKPYDESFTLRMKEAAEKELAMKAMNEEKTIEQE